MAADDEATITGNGRIAAAGRTGVFSWSACSDPGEVRNHNEEFCGAFVPKEPDADRGPAFCVADGLGGHAAGEVASRLAVETLLALWQAGDPAPPPQALRTGVRAANAAILDAAMEGRHGMGTTLTALTLAGREA